MTAAAAASSPRQPEQWQQPELAESARQLRQLEQLQRVAAYLRQVPAWFLATSVDNRPHVRPFSFVEVEELKEPDGLDGVRSAADDGPAAVPRPAIGDGSGAGADAGTDPSAVPDESRCRLWFCTARGKDVYQELQANPWFELSAWHPGQPWLVAWGKAVFAEPSAGLRQRGFEHMVGLGEAHESANDGLLLFFYLEQGWAKICDITGEEQLFKI